MSEKDTEQTIKEAASKLFHEKGFAGTKTRDIAEASGINLALLNYYYRSKKKLYDLIMMETIQTFFSKVIVILEDDATTLRKKIEQFVERYIDMLSDNPDVPAFILQEARQNPEDFLEKIGLLNRVNKSTFIIQFMEEVQKGNIPPINPIHLLMNLAGLVVFPFIAAPMVSAVTKMKQDDLIDLIQERKRLIPLWIDAMLTVK